MGQKVHPHGFRLGVIQNWSSIWFSGKNYAELLHEDLKIRRYLDKRLEQAALAKVVIERVARKKKIVIYTARPGVVIGQRGAEVERLRLELENLCRSEVQLQVHEVSHPELCARLVAQSIAQQLERRVSFRRAMKKAVQATIRAGAKGVRIRVSGRLNGAEIARAEQILEGKVPLHTLRANIDYGVATAFTTYGTIGVKTWIYLGEVMPGNLITGVSAEKLVSPRRGERAERGEV